MLWQTYKPHTTKYRSTCIVLGTVKTMDSGHDLSIQNIDLKMRLFKSFLDDEQIRRNPLEPLLQFISTNVMNLEYKYIGEALLLMTVESSGVMQRWFWDMLQWDCTPKALSKE